MTAQEMVATAKALVAKSKGILAADESTGTMGKRLESIGKPNTEDYRRAWRELMFTTEGAGDFVSGAILYDETIRQKAFDGTPMVELMKRQGIIPGIKVDTGAKDLAGAPGEKVTEGLDGLRERLKEYFDLGARFAKWRGVITIGEDIPSPYCLHVNAHALARYARLCQENGLVPIVEPEVLMDGEHTIGRCEEVTTAALRAVFDELAKQGVVLEQMLLKPNMVISGKGCPVQAGVKEVAERTIATFRRTVPAAVPGIVFLSGGQSDQQAIEHLDAMNRMADLPWEVSYSYGRALQQTALHVWAGEEANVAEAKKAFHKVAAMTSAARDGRYEAA